MDQSGNNQLLLRASQSGPPGYNGYTGQHAAADRMRELLARTVQDHIAEERSTSAALQEIRQRLDDLDDASAAGIAASLDGLAASLGTLDSKLTARLERLDERLDDQYDRVRTLESGLKEQPVSLEEAVAKGVETPVADIMARIASLEDTVLALAEALLRPAIRRLASQRLQNHQPERTRAPRRPHIAHARSIAARGLLAMSRATRSTVHRAV
jgi:chromosome segregation ATPase